MTRTTTTGSGADYRFTAGYPDALNTPDTGNVPGKPPIIFMTGGDIAANTDPAAIGADRLLLGLTDAGYSICQAHVPMGKPFTGSGSDTSGNIASVGNDSTGSPGHNPGAMGRIADAVAWARANLGATADPPIILGLSNGWVCGIIYARQFPITGLIGVLPVVDTDQVYTNNDFGFRDVVNYEWTVASLGALPARARILLDAPNYPNLFGKVLGFYSGNDELYVGGEMAFLVQIHAEMHNIGAYGHLGTLFDSTFPCAHVDVPRMVAFVGERIASL